MKQPQHTLANPGESAVLDCRVLRKVGECRYRAVLDTLLLNKVGECRY
jgi:hypothetical protein